VHSHSHDLEAITAEIAAEMAQAADRGRVADYIPALGSISPAHFGMAIVLADGSIHVAGDAEVPFSIQSISKVFSLTMALGSVGDAIWQRVGREPSGSAFNSIIVCDMLLGRYEPREAIGDLLRFVRALADDSDIVIDEHVARGEAETGFRNFALANYMAAFGNIHHPVERTLGLYFHQCAIAMSCRQLALSGRYLMAGGRNPVTGRSVVSPQRARRINALMLTCGHYDGSGEFAFRVGLPGKSGVGGGILAIAPGVASIAVWSPGLNERGNSQLGTLALERLVQKTGWSIFDPA